MSTEYAFEDYGELKATVADWLMRQDLEDRIPQFIKLAEEFCNSSLRTREMVKRSRNLANAQYISLPTDWRKARNVQRVKDNRALGLMAFDEIDRYRADIKAGRIIPEPGGPIYYALVGETIELAPAPTPDDPHEIEMIYYASVPRLTFDGQSTWLLRKYPAIYLYGALVHSAPFLKDDERVVVWERMLHAAVASANESDADARFSGAPMMRRPTGFGV